MAAIECLYPGICHLGEGPLWHAGQRRLYWTDIYERRLWVFDPGSGSSRVFWQGDLQVGGFAFRRDGALVLCTDRGVYRLGVGTDGEPYAEPQLLHRVPLAENEMFNDITTDPEGRVYAGTLDRSSPTGCLYRLERGKEPVRLLEGIGCSNGMTFSLDQRFFFHTDSLARRITRYEYDRRTGDIRSPRVFFQGSSPDGLPDGITLDMEDHLWVAFWGSAAVRRLDPAGKIVGEFLFPARQVSSVMFGGPGLEELYVTSAAEDAADLSTGRDADGVFLGGPLYRFRPGVRGRPEWPAEL
jgi:sugar lactone lactonase YvrE